MAKYKVSSNSIFRVDATAGGTLINMTAYIDTIDGLGRAYGQLDVTAFADAAERFIPGIELAQEWTVAGHFDDTSTGPHGVFSLVVGTIVTTEWNPAGTASTRPKFTTEALVAFYRVRGEVKGRLEYEAGFRQDGTMVIGTN